MKAKNGSEKVTPQALKDEAFPYKMIVNKDEGLYLGRTLDDKQLIYLKPLFGEVKKPIIFL